MLELNRTYKDFLGNERTETFRFNLTEAELVEMQGSELGGLDKMIEKIMSTQDTPSLIKLFKDLILKSYGEISPDGRRFIKNDEIRNNFASTNAYSDLFVELASNDEAAAKFINGLVPAELAEKVKPELEKMLASRA